MFARLISLAAIISSLLLAPTGLVAQEKLRIVLVSHGDAADPFWAQVKSGAEQAARDMGVEFVYRAPPTFDVDAMAKLLTEAAAEKPGGVIATIPNSEILAAPMRALVSSGIPLITINSGFDVAASLGSLLHIGQSEYEAGRAAGDRMRDVGGTSALCVNHEVGNAGLDLRCKGFIDGFSGSVEVLSVEPDPAAAKMAISERLTGDKAIDVVVALNATIAGEPAVELAKAIGRPLHVATFDLTNGILHAVAEGKASFAVDQQPFLQGYLPVQYLALLARDGVLPVSTVSTGPRLLTAGDAAKRLVRMEPKTD